MNKHINITWNTGNGEKTITFGANTDMEISSLNAKVTLTGNTEVEYYTNIETDDHHEELAPIIDQLLGNIMELQYLPIADEMDPEIIEASEALGRLLQNTNIGHTFDLSSEGDGFNSMMADAEEPDEQEPEGSEPESSTTTAHFGDGYEKSLVAVFDKHIRLELRLSKAGEGWNLNGFLSLGDSFLEEHFFTINLGVDWDTQLSNPWFQKNLKNDALQQMALNYGSTPFAEMIEQVRQYLGLLESFLSACVDSFKETDQNHESDDESVVYDCDNLPPPVIG